MKILLIANMYPNKTYPSYGIFVKNTEDILIKKGHHIERIVLYKEEKKLKKLIKYGVYYLKIFFTLLHTNYDFIYIHYATHSSFPVLLAKRLKKNLKICVNVHGSDIYLKKEKQSILQKNGLRLLKNSDRIVSPSEYFRNYVKNRLKIKTEVVVYPSGGINSEIFHPKEYQESIEQLGLKSGDTYIGYVGRVDQGKGWETMILAVKELKEKTTYEKLKVIIVGDGREKKQLVAFIKKNELTETVICFDGMEQAKLATVYSVLDAFIFPSEHESLGLVGIEALACGCPVIGSRQGGLTDYLIDGVNGLFFRNKDAKDLMKKIEEFYALSVTEKTIMRENALKSVRKYERRQAYKNFEDIFKKS